MRLEYRFGARLELDRTQLDFIFQRESGRCSVSSSREFTECINDSGRRGHRVAGSITGDLAVCCQRISIIPELQHPCAHL